MSDSEWFALNRASWNARTPVHLRSRFYDLEAFKAGQTSLKPIELDSSTFSATSARTRSAGPASGRG